MKLFSYVVARDFGFAPNPFFGACTLATCKPKIRARAAPGDWVVGTGSSAYKLQGRLVYAMQVSETLTYDQYWKDQRFRFKRPHLNGSLKQAYGDNIYHLDQASGRWIQENSHHSLGNGRPNRANVDHDTQTTKMLVGTRFSYWGAVGPLIPKKFRRNDGNDVCGHRGHRSNFPAKFVAAFVEWVETLGLNGYAGAPAEFGR